MNYIGIRGHRGAGKSSIAYLLGNTIEFICQGHGSLLESEMFDIFYKTWCDKLLNDLNCINSSTTNYVYFESFSDSIKTFIRLLLGCPEEYVYEDQYKDLIVINLRDLSYKPKSEYNPDIKLLTASEMYNFIDRDASPQVFCTNTYMTLREFIMYFGLEVMQRFFGRNIWVKSLKANKEQYDRFYDNGNCYKIYIDLKTPAEATYIKQSNGYIVNVNRPSNKKGQSGLERLMRDDRIDYNITVEGDLYSTKDKIIEIAKDIINNFNKENGKRNNENDREKNSVKEDTKENSVKED